MVGAHFEVSSGLRGEVFVPLGQPNLSDDIDVRRLRELPGEFPTNPASGFRN